MSDPTPEVLTAYKSDLNQVVNHRQTLLEQLYATTLSFLELKAPSVRHDDLASFLDANDISKGRSFDLSTLPGADILGHEPVHPSSRKAGSERSRSQDVTAELFSESSSAQISQALSAKNVRSSSKNHRTYEEREVSTTESDITGNDRVKRLGDILEDTESIGSSQPKQFSSTNATTDGAINGSVNSNPAEQGSSSLQAQRQLYGETQRAAFDNYDKEPSDVVSEQKEEVPKTSDGSNRVEDPVHSSKPPNERRDTQDVRAPHPPSRSKTESGEHIARTRGDDAHENVADLPSQFLRGNLNTDNPMEDAITFNADSETHHNGLIQGPRGDEARPMTGQASGFRGHVVAGINGEASGDVTFSRRPPMRIDTRMPLASDSNSVTPGPKTSTANAALSQAATPSKTSQASASASSPPERMTTRFSSGAIRHKSVSELMGETPKIVQSQADKGKADGPQDESAILETPKSASPFVASDPAAFKLRLNEMKEREKNKQLSTVIFPKQQLSTTKRPSETVRTQQVDKKETPIKDRDYLLTLLVAQVYSPNQPHRADRQPLTALIKSAHKTLSTTDLYTDFHERQDARILSKVRYLQEYNKWALRQPERSVEPERSATHWDVLLGQMKWMRTDFREERKWKRTAARHLAIACAQWVTAPIQERRLLQVRTKPIEARPRSRSNSESQSAVTPELVHSAEDDQSETMEDDFAPAAEDPPAAIFSLPPDMFVFGVNKSPVADKILHELPLYQPNAEFQNGALHVTEFSPDASWKTSLIPISKYALGKIVRFEEEPPRKRSRLQYDDEDDTEIPEKPLDPENVEVALFNPEHKHIRDRIHTGHAFRPPSEHIMPSQSFFECRQPSQWTLAEDDELRRLVREYAYNWSLISNCLSSPSDYSSGAERRTPWECFERWVTLEGLPTEMSKVNYFRAYHARLQAAARNYETQQQAFLQQNPGSAHIPRRRSTQPYTVDRRKNNKHIHLIDAMRKQAKKRETKILKDQHTATTAAMRKANEPQKPRQQIYTPREFSRIKYERQLQREEHLKAARLQFMQQQKALAASRANQQSGSQISGYQGQRNLVQGAPNGSGSNLASAIPQLRGGIGDPARSGPHMHRLMNGQTNAPMSGSSQSVPHAPMQPSLSIPPSQRLPPQMGSDSMRVLQEATRVQAEQQAQQQRQRQQQHPQYNGQVNSSGSPALNSSSQTNPNMPGSVDGRSSPAMNGSQSQGSSSPPRLNHPQALSSGMTPAVNQISNQIKMRNPQASPEQVSRATNEQLYRMTQAARQATQAAVGNPAGGNMSSNGGMPNMGSVANGNGSMLSAQQQYAQMMREQHRPHQRAGSVGSANMNGSRSATPMNQRSGSAQSGRGLSQSPRAGQVGLAGGQ